MRWSQKRKSKRHTSFGEVKLLLDQVRDEAEKSDETTEGGADDVEVDYCQIRHTRMSYGLWISAML